jgi:hypothetical protein
MRKNKKAARQGGPESSTRRDITTLLWRLQSGTDCLIEIAGSIALGSWAGVAAVALWRMTP